MLIEFAVAAAVALTPLAVPTPSPAPVEGTVVAKWYDSNTPGFLRMPIGPECWGMTINPPDIWANSPDICVDKATWYAHPIGSHYQGA